MINFIIKVVKDYPMYYVSEAGDVYSLHSGKMKKMKLWLDGQKDIIWCLYVMGIKYLRKN